MFLIVVSLLMGLTVTFSALLFTQPEWLFSTLRQVSPQVLYSVTTDEKVVALTIDDGPDPLTSPLILDVLDKYNAHATFFLISERIPGNETLVREMVSQGNELGNHMTLDEPSIRLDLDEFEDKLMRADRALSPFGEVRWARPGSGWYNDEMLAVMREHGYRCALGSVYPYDPIVGSAWFASRYILWKVKPGGIIVLHDFGRRGERTAKSLQMILPELERRGYRVVTLSELYELRSPEK